jgi:DNA helicase-2/ATP-dependent DNA helicase PcrA
MTPLQNPFERLASDLSLEYLWDHAKFTPNENQEKAIRHVEGPLFLPAGPGSGKTRVLLWRTLNLIVFHDVKPGEIFLSTFTEKAAHQLKEGLRGLLGIVTGMNGQPYDLSPMFIGTVHSLCRRILNERRAFSPDAHRRIVPGLMDELDQYFFINRSRNWAAILGSIGLEPGYETHLEINRLFGYQNRGSKHQAVTNCITFFNRAAEECVDPQEAIRRLENPDGDLQTHMITQNLDREDLIQAFKLYQTYEHLLRTEDQVPRVDFAHLQQEAFQVLTSAEEATRVFKYVIVDEYQDTNAIQERIFFRLAEGHHNLCVVGDDDQALYRFRGATVENFVDFPTRCLKHLDESPKKIPLSINYRSRQDIVHFYTRFIQKENWRKEGGGFFRVADKAIRAHNQDPAAAVVASSPMKPLEVCDQTAVFVKRLITEKKVQDPNQIAFLFPSLKSDQVKRMKAALENQGLSVYAPRAGSFLETDEALDVFGVMTLILGRPDMRGNYRGDWQDFANWIERIENNAEALVMNDPQLEAYITDKQDEIERIRSDYRSLMAVIQREGWEPDAPYALERMKRKLYNAPGLSEEGKKLIGSSYLDRVVQRRAREGRPFSLKYILNRSTSLDWSLLDLFYRLTGFDNFKRMFDLAESGRDEGPICNLGLITEYLSRFGEDFIPMITAELFENEMLHRVFFKSYLYSLFRLGETEYEDIDDPFPKGRIPFLTIHQSKGLEFPVVVLGNPYRRRHQASFTERAIRPFTAQEESEPLDRIPNFDTARMFYVALSRAEKLLLVAHFKGRGQRMDPLIKALLTDDFPRIPNLDFDGIPDEVFKPQRDLPEMYSYTADFLLYKKCPRQYMVFRKYGFVPSRAQTMFFGSLVHRTLEDLHLELIHRREEGAQ